MSEQLLDFIQALIGIFIVFGAMGIGCAVWEFTAAVLERRRRKKQERKRKRMIEIKWNN